MKDMGQFREILGFEIERDRSSILNIKQSSCCEKNQKKVQPKSC